ncbi:MAG: hypothetical protein OM95_01425 [Bdellovibrio sp. ArHS]|uniref:TolB family protein n=1 Tax=Bdellovibrio sp. ArHS TaxID=1569284 RepID=UPI000582FC8E|nr:PD40 domain-containing protein [Bdellovibrio sp. ArHS]KHD89761.1 MAG: hypothetical protein OM95_01425 [Bdellovibrio sp. ArHS]
MYRQHVLLLLLSIISLFSPLSRAQLEVPPDIQWKTLKTPHFEVIFNAKQQDLGLLYAEKLEKAYAELRSYFHSLPEKTIVIINDKTDVTNGYATRIPYPHIMAYPVLPGPEESLADTGDWAFELLAHEYTHILNFEPANGIMKPLRFVFGNIIAPNILLPTWWKEGVAVEMETRLGNHGRLRSFYQDATIRAMVEDQTFHSYDIAEVNEVIPTWPEGMRPYLFGSLMWSQMFSEKGLHIAKDLNERQGGRVPYFIETPAKEILGMNYTAQYNDMLNEVAVRAQNQLKTIREVKVTNVIIPKNTFISVTAPSISPDGKHLAVVTEDDANSRAIKIITRETAAQSFLDAKSADTVEKFNQDFTPSAQQDGPPTGSIQRISWFPNSAKIVYDKIDYVNRIERYSDLHTYDLNTKKAERLTTHLRGREPAVSPDGKAIVFVKLEGGKTHLGVLREQDGSWTEQTVYSPDFQQRISYPLFWNEDVLLFSLRKVDGSEHLYSHSLSTQKTDVLFPQYKNVRFAKKTPEGLLFTSGNSGVLNLYLADPSLKTARPITNTLTAFFTADYDPLSKDLFATHMTSQGPKVVAIPASEWQNTPSQIPEVNGLMADRYPPIAPNEKSLEEARAALSQSSLQDYSPYGYLWPQYWMPFVSGSSSETGIILTAQTSGFDPLKKHSYTLIGSWDTGLNRGSLLGTYLNQTTALPWTTLAYKRSSYLGTVTNELNDYGLAAALLPSMFWISKYTNLQIGWQYLERETTTTETKRTGPYVMLSHANYSKAGAQISPETGGGAYLGAYDYLEQEGYLSHSQFLAGGEVYLSRYLPKHHALMLRTNAAYTPEKVSAIYGVSTEPLVFIPDSPLPQYILRGYKRGQLFGKNMWVVNAEYRLPVLDFYRGSGTDPLFLRRLSAAIIADGAAADGLFVNDIRSIYESVDMKRWFWSSGLELKLETTLGYVIPVSLVVGYYMAFNTPSGPEGVIGSALQITGF